MGKVTQVEDRDNLYQIINPEIEIYIIQHLESGNYYFPGYKTREEAANEDWQDDFFDEDFETLAEAREKHLATFITYEIEHILETAREGYDYPIDFGLVLVVPKKLKHGQEIMLRGMKCTYFGTSDNHQYFGKHMFWTPRLDYIYLDDEEFKKLLEEDGDDSI